MPTAVPSRATALPPSFTPSLFIRRAHKTPTRKKLSVNPRPPKQPGRYFRPCLLSTKMRCLITAALRCSPVSVIKSGLVAQLSQPARRDERPQREKQLPQPTGVARKADAGKVPLSLLNPQKACSRRIVLTLHHGELPQESSRPTPIDKTAARPASVSSS